MRAIKSVGTLVIHHKYRRNPTLVPLKLHRINMVKLFGGDRIVTWPHKIRNTEQKKFNGPNVLKIIVSNVNEHDMFLEVYDQFHDIPRIALIECVYPPITKPNIIFKNVITKPKDDNDRPYK